MIVYERQANGKNLKKYKQQIINRPFPWINLTFLSTLLLSKLFLDEVHLRLFFIGHLWCGSRHFILLNLTPWYSKRTRTDPPFHFLIFSSPGKPLSWVLLFNLAQIIYSLYRLSCLGAACIFAPLCSLSHCSTHCIAHICLSFFKSLLPLFLSESLLGTSANSVVSLTCWSVLDA